MRMTYTLQYHKNILGHAVVNVILPKEYNCDEWENILQYFSFYIKTKQSLKVSSCVTLAMFEILRSHVWVVATLLASVDRVDI